MGANQQYWRRRGGERVLRLGDVPSKAGPDTMLKAMQAWLLSPQGVEAL